MKFRRKQAHEETAAAAPADAPADPADPADSAPETTDPSEPAERRPDGPWDSSEVEIDEDDATKIDLGGLIVTGRPGLEMRLQVDAATQKVAAVLLLTAEGAVELRPFAAPRNADIWDDLRRKIAGDTAQRGGTADEADGIYGKELRVVMPVTTPDGQQVSQPSRVHGIRGPRWLLRATFLGQPALEPDPAGLVETALREVIVVRGKDPMSPGEALPLVMPANAQPLQPGQPGQPPS